MRNPYGTTVASIALSLTLSIVSTALAGQTSQANPPQEATAVVPAPHHAATVDRKLDRLSQTLNLTEEQRQKIRPLLKHETERIDEVRSNTSLSQGETQRRIQGIRRDTNGRIRELLSPEQKQQWQDDREQKRAERTKQVRRPLSPG